MAIQRISLDRCRKGESVYQVCKYACGQRVRAIQVLRSYGHFCDKKIFHREFAK